MINIKENEKLSIMNHSCAHLMAQAIKHLYPNAKFWVGPVISEGFYYDVDLEDEVLTEEDLPKIEKEMKKLSKDGKRIVRNELSKEEALEMFKDDPYKIDLISRMDEEENVISCYTQGDFTDLCRGPHVDTVKVLKNFKLLKASGVDTILPEKLQKLSSLAKLPKDRAVLSFVFSIPTENADLESNKSDENKIQIIDKVDKTISIIPFENSVISLCGFKYETTETEFKKGSTLGMSNIVLNSKAEINIKSGGVFLIINN